MPNVALTCRPWHVSPLLTRIGSLAQDKDALEDFFNSTNGPQWSRKEGWRQASDLNNWEGVRVRGGRVVWLTKNKHKITGKDYVASYYEVLHLY